MFCLGLNVPREGVLNYFLKLDARFDHMCVCVCVWMLFGVRFLVLLKGLVVGLIV